MVWHTMRQTNQQSSVSKCWWGLGDNKQILPCFIFAWSRRLLQRHQQQARLRLRSAKKPSATEGMNEASMMGSTQERRNCSPGPLAVHWVKIGAHCLPSNLPSHYPESQTGEELTQLINLMPDTFRQRCLQLLSHFEVYHEQMVPLARPNRSLDT